MARGFNTTFGVGNSDKVQTAYGAVAYTTRSLYIRANRHLNGGGSLGRMASQLTGVELVDSNGTTGWAFTSMWSGANGSWTFPRPADDAWWHVGWTYNGSSDANIPVGYLNGVSQTINTLVSPSGTLSTPTSNFILGNNELDTRWWDGKLSDFAVWDVILTAAEMAALAKGISPLVIRSQSLRCYVPMNRSGVDYKNSATTITGTAVQPHTRIIMPRSSKMRRISAMTDTRKVGITGLPSVEC